MCVPGTVAGRSVGADMTIKNAGLAAMVCALGAGSAHAATTHVFDLSTATREADNTFSFDSVVGDETLTGVFTGGYVIGASVDVDDELVAGSFSSDVYVGLYNNGLGVCRAGEGACATTHSGAGEPHTVDGATDGTSDFIEMAFYLGDTLVDVTLQSLTFGWIGEWEYQNSGQWLGFDDTTGAFEIIVDTLDGGGDLGIGLGDFLALSDTVDANLDEDLSRGLYDLSGLNLVDSIFGVTAGDSGSWKLLSATVSFSAPPPEIPLPAAFWLLLGGVGGLMALKRQKAT